MSVYHDEIEIEDFEYDEETDSYYFPCPCGDRFVITKLDLQVSTSTEWMNSFLLKWKKKSI